MTVVLEDAMCFTKIGLDSIRAVSAKGETILGVRWDNGTWEDYDFGSTKSRDKAFRELSKALGGESKDAESQ